MEKRISTLKKSFKVLGYKGTILKLKEFGFDAVSKPNGLGISIDKLNLSVENKITDIHYEDEVVTLKTKLGDLKIFKR